MWRFKFYIFLIPFILLIGQDKDRILFPHQLHIEDVELSCEECHTGVAEADGPTWDIFPKMDYCADCHEDDTDDGDCSFCHTDSENPQSFNNYWKSSGLGFSHKKHLIESEDCLKCHSYIGEDREIGLPNVWNKTDCQTCHSKIDDGPSSHDLLWIEIHGSELNSSTIGDCSLCHTNNSCEECHRLQQFEPTAHTNDYALLHSFEAKAGVTECTTCHEIVEDCYSCHVSNQVMPMNHNFHDWVSLNDGGLHGEFAEGDAELCATCHLPSKDSSCLKCHLGD